MGSALVLPFVALFHYTPLGYIYNIYFWWKTYESRQIVSSYVEIRKKENHVAEYACDIQKSPEEFGIIENKQHWKEEIPQKQLSKGQDKIFFSGANASGDHLITTVSILPGKLHEAQIYLKLKDGRSFTLPQPCSGVFSTSDQTFKAERLKIQCLRPHRKWRISFNGVLRSNEEEEAKHVKFLFLWTPLGPVQDLTYDIEDTFLVEALEQEKENKATFFKKILDQSQRHDVWGQLHGTLTVEGESEIELWMRGIKIRDRSYPKDKDRSIEFYSYVENGQTIQASVLTIDCFKTSVKNGFYVNPARKGFNLTESSLYLLSPEELLQKKNLVFKTAFNDVKLELEAVTAECEVASSLGHLTRTVFVKVKQGKYSGQGFFQYTTRRTPVPVSRSLVPKITVPEPLQGDTLPFVISLREPLCKNVDLVGGKGASLAHLLWLSRQDYYKESSFPFQVPSGWVVTNVAYNLHLEKNLAIKQAVKELKQSLKFKSMELFKEKCNNITKLFEESQMPVSLLEQIEAFIHEGKEDVIYAVRSSAIGEDGTELSAAGQMDTFLGMKGSAQISKAILKCWASQFSFVAVQYKRQNGQLLDAGMGVVVQEIVSAEVAGVMFTCDPVTGNPKNLHITANYGLGESVVSASADPDTVVIDRSTESLSIQSMTIGQKSTRIDINDSGEGTKEHETNQTDSSQCCISESDILKLANLGVHIETSYSMPVDIEWALVQSSIYLLQARPITTLDPWRDFEIAHEFDHGLLTDYEYTTRANTGEVMPGALSPLTIESVVSAMEITFRAAMAQKNKERFCPYLPNTLYISHNQCLLNLIDGLMRDNQSIPDKNKMQPAYGMELAIFGRILPNTVEIRTRAIERHGLKGKFQNMFFYSQIVMTYLYIEKMLKKSSVEINGMVIIKEEDLNSKQIIDKIYDNLNLVSKSIMLHGGATMLSSFCNIFLIIALTRIHNTLDEKLYCLFSKLSSNNGEFHVESAEVPAALKALEKKISQSTNKEFFTSATPAEALEWIQKDDTEAGKMFASFLDQHGHRCFKEFDLATITWEMDPTLLVETLQKMVANPRADQANTHPSVDEILDSVGTPVSYISRLIIKQVVKYARYGVRVREIGKTVLIKTVDILRKAYLKLGNTMVAEGRIPDADLVFFFTNGELKEFIKTRNPRMLSKVIKRRAIHPRLNKMIFPEICSGLQKPIQTGVKIVNGDGSALIKGTPVCEGVITGVARVVMDLEEAVNIKSGDILVTYSTDIGWTPYFPLLSGVVTELGGLVSHGAVVAREYGLPCIVSAQGATSAISSGDLVVLDGTKGTLTKVEH